MIQETVNQELKQAMKSGDDLRLSVLRNIKTEIANELVEKGEKPSGELADNHVIEVLARLAKQRRESAEEFENGGRDELAQKERDELEIIEEYLPEKMSQDELDDLVTSKIAEAGAEDMGDMGQVMGQVMSEVGPATSGDDVRKLVESKLS